MADLEIETIVGYTDGFRLGYVEGWAWRPLDPHNPVIVELLVDGVLVAESTACVPRPDLQTAGIGNGHYAFALPFPIHPHARSIVHITVRAKDGPVLPGGMFDVTTSPQDLADLSRRQSLAYLEEVFGPLGTGEPKSRAHRRSPAAPKLNFLLYSAVGGSLLAGALGMPDYSYFFVMRGFREVLRRLGTVHVVRNPAEEVDDIYDICTARGEECLFLSFAPPQGTQLGLRCPTVPVIAWEFGTIPTGGWRGDPREDWRPVLRQTGRAITISAFAACAIRATMGATYPVAFVPTPVWDRQAAMRGRRGEASAGLVSQITLAPQGLAWDSLETKLSLDMRTPSLPQIAPAPAPQSPMRDARFLLAEFSAAANTNARTAIEPTPPEGPAESPGVDLPTPARGGLHWYRRVVRDALPGPLSQAISRVGRRTVILRSRLAHAPIPATVSGSVPVSDSTQAAQADAACNMPASDEPTHVPALAEPRLPPTARYLPIDEAAKPDTAASRPRYMPAQTEPMLPEPTLATFDPDPYPFVTIPACGPSVTADGIVFTAVLSPKDGRKNWQDILTAFTAAFRDTPGTTLILKMIGSDATFWWSEFHSIVRTLPKFACRVLVLSGYLDDDNYQALIDATHFIVNASLAEGQCLPLVEFMAACRPAIAPLHTAMLDYVTTENALIIASSVEFCSWPHDPRNHLTTTRHRIEWPSIRDAFTTAFRIATQDTQLYAKMADAAAASVQAYCADSVVAPRMAAFLGLGDEVLLRTGWQPLERDAAEDMLERRNALDSALVT